MDAKQLEALTSIWGADVAAQIVTLGKQQTEAKEKDGVAFKAKGTEKTEDTEQKQDEKTKGDPTPGDKELLVQTIAEELQLGELSTAFKAIGNVVAALAEQQKALEARTKALEQDDETRLAEKETHRPRYSWFRDSWFKASTAAETVLQEGDALKSVKPSAPSVIQNIAGKVT